MQVVTVKYFFRILNCKLFLIKENEVKGIAFRIHDLMSDKYA